MSSENLDQLAIELGLIKEQQQQLSARAKEIESVLRPAIAGKGPMRFEFGGDAGPMYAYVFSVKEMPGRKSLDKEAMIEDGIDVERYQKVGKPYTQLSFEKVDLS